jgi:N-acetylmuramoyl-L-alanine amidase
MSEFADLKRRIVRQTVAENVALIEGTRLAREPVRRKRLHARLGLFLAVLLLGAAGTSVLLSRPWVQEEPAAADAVDVVEKPPAEVEPVRRHLAWAGEAPALAENPPPRIDPSIFPLRVRHVVLDPGHGGEDLGTRHGTLYEKNLTLDIALRLRELLRGEGFEVSMTREADDGLELRERRDLANRLEADVFVSIHLNWIASRSVRGVETYFLGPTVDPELNALARRENARSGYTLAEQSQLVRGLVLNAQHQRSEQLAGRVQQTLFRSLRDVNPELKDRGVKTAPFVVLIGTEMPAILAEVSCLSNDEEVELLGRPLYRDTIATALFQGVSRYARDVGAADGADVGP